VSIASAAAIVVVNKLLLSELNSTLAALFLVPLHAVCLLAYCFIVMPKVDKPFHSGPFVTLAGLGVISLFANNFALVYGSVTLQQVCRLLSIPMGAMVDRLYWGEEQEWTFRRAVTMAGVTAGAGLVCFAQRSESDESSAIALAVLANLAGVASSVWSQVVTRQVCITCNLSSMECMRYGALYFAIAAVLTALAGAAARNSGDASDTLHSLSRFGFESDAPLPARAYGLLVASCALAVLVQYVVTYLSRRSSALIFALLRLAKSVFTVCAGAVILGEELSATAVAGTVVCLLSFGLHLHEGFDGGESAKAGAGDHDPRRWLALAKRELQSRPAVTAALCFVLVLAAGATLKTTAAFPLGSRTEPITLSLAPAEEVLQPRQTEKGTGGDAGRSGGDGVRLRARRAGTSQPMNPVVVNLR